jgi:hypothetical protein
VGASRETQFLRDTGQGKVRGKPQGKAHHAL